MLGESKPPGLWSRLRIRLAWTVLATTVLVIAFSITVGYFYWSGRGGGGTAPAPMAVISRNVPTYASHPTFAPSLATDIHLDTLWRTPGSFTGGTAWVAMDLSSKTVVQRTSTIFAWHANISNGAYNAGSTAAQYNLPRTYTIDGHAGKGGGLPPVEGDVGWVTIERVTDNIYNGRQHPMNISSYNWVRMRQTTFYTTQASNQGMGVNIDIHDSSAGNEDNWIIYGSSTPGGGFSHNNLATTAYGTVTAFGTMISAVHPDRFPLQQPAAIGGTTAVNGNTNIDTWLPLFPGQYVILGYGANDANSASNPATQGQLDIFYNNMKSMVDKVIAADKVPVIALIQWGRATNLHANVTAYNNVIKQLWAEYPVIVQGPDFETFFRNNQNLISADGIHPTSPEGFGAYRKLWIEDMLAKVYSGSVQHLRATTGLTQEQICTARLDEETQCPIPQHVQPGERKRIRQH